MKKDTSTMYLSNSIVSPGCIVPGFLKSESISTLFSSRSFTWPNCSSLRNPSAHFLFFCHFRIASTRVDYSGDQEAQDMHAIAYLGLLLAEKDFVHRHPREQELPCNAIRCRSPSKKAFFFFSFGSLKQKTRASTLMLSEGLPCFKSTI